MGDRIKGLMHPEKPETCFPDDAQVMALDGGKVHKKRMCDISIGDFVLGKSGFQQVFLMGHCDPDAQTSMIKILTESGHQLTMSPEHYGLVGGTLPKQAKSLCTGDHLLVQQIGTEGAEIEEVMSSITNMEVVETTGLYNPFTPDGTIFVNGVLVSTYSTGFLTNSRWVPEKLKPTVYHMLILLPLYMMYLIRPDWFKRFHTHVVGQGVTEFRDMGLKGFIKNAAETFWADKKPLLVQNKANNC